MSKTVEPAPQAESKPMSAVKARGHVMVAVRLGDVERERTARRNLAEAKIAEYIEKTLAAAPPLNQTQINRLSGLLRGAK